MTEDAAQCVRCRGHGVVVDLCGFVSRCLEPDCVESDLRARAVAMLGEPEARSPWPWKEEEDPLRSMLRGNREFRRLDALNLRVRDP